MVSVRINRLLCLNMFSILYKLSQALGMVACNLKVFFAQFVPLIVEKDAHIGTNDSFFCQIVFEEWFYKLKIFLHVTQIAMQKTFDQLSFLWAEAFKLNYQHSNITKRINKAKFGFKIDTIES